MSETFTCPRCGMVSGHPTDLKEGYCGNCHDFTGVERPPTVKQLADPRKDATWTLMPAPPGTCSQCARDHEPEQPHDQQSLHYQCTFYSEHGRWPTWGDAMAHCSERTQQAWRDGLRERGVPEKDLEPSHE